MAVSHANSNLGSVRTQEGAHEYMKEIRAHLLAVGMEELAIEGTYDASESGDSTQVPIERPARNSPLSSTWMHFAFTDDRQSENPIVVSFRVMYGYYFNYKYDSSGIEYPRYSIRVRISQGVDAAGEPLGAVLDTNNTGSRQGYSYEGQHELEDRTGLGSFVRYAGDSLTMLIDHDGTYTNSGGNRGAVQLHIERLSGNDFVVMPLTAGTSNGPAQRVYYSSGSSIYSRTDLQTRPGGGLNMYEESRAVVTPIYAPLSSGGLATLKRAFIAPEDIGSATNIISMDFSGAEKPYLLIKQNAMKAYESGTAWLYEWE